METDPFEGISFALPSSDAQRERPRLTAALDYMRAGDEATGGWGVDVVSAVAGWAGWCCGGSGMRTTGPRWRVAMSVVGHPRTPKPFLDAVPHGALAGHQHGWMSN